jgi:hypothetical protein
VIIHLVASIARDHVTEDEPNHFSADASLLGFSLHDWPSEMQTTLGNGQPFVHAKTKRATEDQNYTEGEIVSAIYEQGGGSGAVLTVIND